MKRYLLLILSILCNTVNAKAINYLVDLNGVVVSQSTYSFTRHVGWFSFIGAYNPVTLQATLFDYLHRVKPLQPETPLAYYHNKFPISQIQCEYLCGLIDSNIALQMINATLNEIKPTIDSKRKVELIRSIATVMFTPKLFAPTIIRLKDGYQMVKWINGHNTPGSQDHHRIIFVSNWDKESFPLLYQNPGLGKLFDLAEAVVISGEAKLMKPDPEFYEYVFEKYNIDPENEITFFIDDEPCNIQSAQEMKYKRLVPIRYKSFSKTKKIIKKHYSAAAA